MDYRNLGFHLQNVCGLPVLQNFSFFSSGSILLKIILNPDVVHRWWYFTICNPFFDVALQISRVVRASDIRPLKFWPLSPTLRERAYCFFFPWLCRSFCDGNQDSNLFFLALHLTYINCSRILWLLNKESVESSSGQMVTAVKVHGSS